MPPIHRPPKPKRKRPSETTSLDRPQQIPSQAYIQAYEAQLIYGRTEVAARLAERSAQGSAMGLIRWGGESGDGVEEGVWLDR